MLYNPNDKFAKYEDKFLKTYTKDGGEKTLRNLLK